MRLLCLILLASMTTALGGVQVFRSVDSEGNVTYSDRPEGENPEAVLVVTRGSTGSSSRSTATRLTRAGSPAPAPGTEETFEEVTREPTADERDSQRAGNCAIAREHLERYEVSHRLYRTGADGEREYLSDAEIDEARTRAASDVEEWCD